jgi:hypothetical protein
VNAYDRERERIGRLRENGYLTAYEHRRRSEMIDRSERRAATAAERAERQRESKRRCRAKQKLRSALVQSLEQSA